MKRVFQTLVFLFIFYYAIQLLFIFFDKGYEATYTILTDNKEAVIKETYTSNRKNERDNYYLEMVIDNNVFYYKTYENFKKAKNIVSDIKYYHDDNYSCILPIFKNNNILTDIMCQNSDKIIYYHDIMGVNNDLDNFAGNIENYKVNDWIDNEQETTNLDNILVYKNNLYNGLYVGLTSYTGLYNINDKVSGSIINVTAFKNDIYNPKISTQINHYYLVADYNETYDFSRFYLIDLLEKDKDIIESDKRISLNSYIQGTVKNSVFLIDVDNKKQYEIDTKTKKIIEVGNEENGTKFYNNGNWENKTIFEAIKSEQKFIYQDIDTSKFEKNYVKIDQVGGNESGYYYLYEGTINGYNVYKAYVEQPNKPIYLFSTDKIENIKYIKDSILFIDQNYVKIYSEDKGVRNLVKYDELQFNKNINIYVYYEDYKI